VCDREKEKVRERETERIEKQKSRECKVSEETLFMFQKILLFTGQKVSGHTFTPRKK
jgi:hypothetical protein